MLDIDDFIVDLLVQQGLVDDEQLKEAKERAASEEGSTVLEALYNLKFISEQDVMQLLGAEYGMDTYDFDHASAKVPTEVITLVPRDVAFRYKAVPISFANGILRVAIADPTDIETIDSIRYLLKMEVEPVVSTKRQIEQALGSYYGSMEGDASSILEDMTEATTDLTVGATQDVTMDAKDNKENGEDSAPIIRFVSLLILEAFRTRASDIHLEPLENASASATASTVFSTSRKTRRNTSRIKSSPV